MFKLFKKNNSEVSTHNCQLRDIAEKAINETVEFDKAVKNIKKKFDYRENEPSDINRNVIYSLRHCTETYQFSGSIVVYEVEYIPLYPSYDNPYSTLPEEVISRKETKRICGEELFRIIKNDYAWIENVSEMNGIKSRSDYFDVFAPNKIRNILNGRYSDSFINILVEKGIHNKSLIDAAVALSDEGISPDMRAYILYTQYFH